MCNSKNRFLHPFHLRKHLAHCLKRRLRGSPLTPSERHLHQWLGKGPGGLPHTDISSMPCPVLSPMLTSQYPGVGDSQLGFHNVPGRVVKHRRWPWTREGGALTPRESSLQNLNRGSALLTSPSSTVSLCGAHVAPAGCSLSLRITYPPNLLKVNLYIEGQMTCA